MDMNFRSMVINDNGDLIIANAADDVNQILVFGSCSNSTSTAPLARRTHDRQQKAPIHVLREESGQRIFKGIVTDLKMNRGAEHPYGLALDADQNIYSSFQHTDVVLRFFADSHKEMPLPPVVERRTDRAELFPGTFHQFGKPHVHIKQHRGVRGIAVVGDQLWVANRNLGGVEVFDLASGATIDFMAVRRPIGVFYSPEHGLVFVSSKGKKSKGRKGGVLAFSAATRMVNSEMRTHHMYHPTGMAIYGDVLYVADQKLGHVMAFHVPTSTSLGKAVKHIPGRVEQLVLSDC